MNTKDPLLYPDLLQRCLDLTKDTFTTLIQIKQKRSAMSQDNKPFQWDDKKIKDFAEYYRKTQGNVTPEMWGKDLLEEFKASNSSLKKEVDWAIQCLVVDTRNYWLQKSGLYKNELFGIEHSADDIMKWPGFKYIHSVKRLSDGEVFSIGDQIGWGEVGTYKTELLSFRINPERNNRLEFEYQITEKNRSFCDFLDAVKLHKKQSPLFTTEDGVKIFAGQTYWQVEDFEVRTMATHLEDNGEWYKHQKNTFSTIQTAREYVIMNKPCLSASEVIEIWKEDNYFPAVVKQLASSKIEGGK